MTRRRPIAALFGLIYLCGCHAAQPTTPASIETFRNAAAADLSLGILNVSPGSDGFPQPIVNLRSLSSDELIVSYAPRTLAIHCGPYMTFGPPVTYGIRREILDAFGYMDFPPPTSGWIRHTPGGPLELLHPTQLPPGTYDLWATFYVSGPQGGVLETPHQNYATTQPAGR